MQSATQRSIMVQACLDVESVEQALSIAHMAIRAGVDWLEAGTPLILFNGLRCVRSISDAFPGREVIADMKLLDGARKYVVAAGHNGASMVTVSALASDATIRAAVSGGRATGTRIVADLYACADPVRRAEEVTVLGVDAVYLHYGADQRTEDPTDDHTASNLRRLRGSGFEPAVGVVAFDAEGAGSAAAMGADVILVGHPYLVGPDSETMLTELVRAVKQAPSVAMRTAVGDER